MNDQPISRRTFLRRAGGVAVGLSLIPLAGCEENAVTPLVEGTEIPFLTPNSEFFLQYGGTLAPSWGGIQHLSREDWMLHVQGLVENPLTLQYADLEAEMDHSVTVLKTIRCIIDSTSVPGLIGTALWTGIPLRIFLNRAGIDLERTKRLRFFGADGFTNNLTLDHVYGDRPTDLFEPLLVFAMNGEPLTNEHGFPVRLLVHELYGYKNVKWLTRIEATDIDEPFGTYQDAGYVDDGVIRPVSKVTNPLQNTTLAAGSFRIAGFAVSGFAGVDQVEVSIDEAPFEPARIVPLSEIAVANPAVRSALQFEDQDRFPFPYRGVWTLWEYEWEAAPGTHTIEIRARDQQGNVQPESDPDPADGNNPVARVTVRVA